MLEPQFLAERGEILALLQPFQQLFLGQRPLDLAVGIMLHRVPPAFSGSILPQKAEIAKISCC
jgi:hypothetical protein